MNDELARSWADKVKGNACPFDHPRGDLSENLFLIAPLSACTLYLERNQIYRGYCIAVYNRHVTRVDELTMNEWLDLAGDLHRAQSAIWKVCSPAHLNVASLGNLVPHLHWHLIPRYLDDPRWGRPIWSESADMPRRTLGESDYEELAKAIRTALPPRP